MKPENRIKGWHNDIAKLREEKALTFLPYRWQCFVDKIEEIVNFAEDLLKQLKKKNGANPDPDLGPYFEKHLEQIKPSKSKKRRKRLELVTRVIDGDTKER